MDRNHFQERGALPTVRAIRAHSCCQTDLVDDPFDERLAAPTLAWWASSAFRGNSAAGGVLRSSASCRLEGQKLGLT